MLADALRLYRSASDRGRTWLLRISFCASSWRPPPSFLRIRLPPRITSRSSLLALEVEGARPTTDPLWDVQRLIAVIARANTMWGEEAELPPNCG